MKDHRPRNLVWTGVAGCSTGESCLSSHMAPSVAWEARSPHCGREWQWALCDPGRDGLGPWALLKGLAIPLWLLFKG